jgi:hypothetical protein|tara:strand:+ start:136 stop:249 length:114 start_codon:yes stop_codon:yes gene_type:complete
VEQQKLLLFICQIKDLKAMKKGTKKHTITEKKRAPLT